MVRHDANAAGVEKIYSNEIAQLRANCSLFRTFFPASASTKRAQTSASGHPGEEGRWCESLLAEFLRRRLPENLEVSTGFIADPARGIRSYQTDIIIHDRLQYSPILRYGDAAVVLPRAVVAAISVKYRLRRRDVVRELSELREIGKICNDGDARGPYLAILSFEMQNDRKGGRIPSYEALTKFIQRTYSDFSTQEGSGISANEIVDSVISLDGYLMHVSKGNPLPRSEVRENVKFLWADSSRTRSFAMLTELIEGIQKRNGPASCREGTPSRSHHGMKSEGHVKIACFGRPFKPSK